MAKTHKYNFKEMSEVGCGNPDCRKPLKKMLLRGNQKAHLYFVGNVGSKKLVV
jgi:hypothetical protein